MIPSRICRPITAKTTGRVVTLADGSTIIKGTYKLDPTQQPKALDLTDTFGADAGLTFLAIYRLEGDRLTFDVRVLEGDLAGADGPAAVFIDIIGMPLTPLSFAGVARRSARRAYWYGAAAAPYYRPYGYPGYYPPPYYPPYPY